MYCTSCGKRLEASSSFCPACGHAVGNAQGVIQSNQNVQVQAKNSRTAIGVISLLLAALSTVFCLVDFGLLQQGEAEYILVSEIWILFAMGVPSLVLGIISAAGNSIYGKLGSAFGLLSVFLTLNLAKFSA